MSFFIIPATLTEVGTENIADGAVTQDKLADSINPQEVLASHTFTGSETGITFTSLNIGLGDIVYLKFAGQIDETASKSLYAEVRNTLTASLVCGSLNDKTGFNGVVNISKFYNAGFSSSAQGLIGSNLYYLPATTALNLISAMRNNIGTGDVNITSVLFRLSSGFFKAGTSVKIIKEVV